MKIALLGYGKMGKLIGELALERGHQIVAKIDQDNQELRNALDPKTIDVAIEGVRSALDIAKHHGAKFLFTSSSEVYQTPDVIPTPETYVGAIPSNTERSCYDVSKLMAENLVYVYSHNYGVNGCSVRIFNSFGVGISEADSRILPRIASAAKSKNKIKIYKND